MTLETTQCCLCGQTVYRTFKFRQLHYICEQFLMMLPPGTQVKVTWSTDKK